jgi:peptidyl-prolyl cis-trans isomerase C
MNSALFPDLIVNGERVEHTLIAAETQNHEAPQGKPGIAWRKAVNAIAIRTLLLQEARSRGIEADQQEVSAGRFETDEEALIREVLDQGVDVEAPQEAAIRTEWLKDQTRFRSPPLWEVSHILCACDPRDAKAREEALVRARDILAGVLKEPKSFARVASQVSECGSKSSGGALGPLGLGDTVPEFEAALRGLEAGTITSEPVVTRYGVHVIRMDAVAEGQILPFEAVRDKIGEAMEKAAWAKGARAFVDGLVEAAEITGADLKAA